MYTKIYWLHQYENNTRLAIMARPRGGEWLEDEIVQFKKQHVNVIVSLLGPAEIAELAAMGGTRAAVVPELLALLRDEHRLVEIAPGLFLDADVESDVRRKVADRLADGSTLSMGDLRDLVGTTRKYAVPLGEHLDRVGLTRREGDVRLLKDASIGK